MECPRIAKLSANQLEEIRRMEEKTGLVLVAYERLPKYKKLSPEELKKVQAMEREIGGLLVAYES